MNEYDERAMFPGNTGTQQHQDIFEEKDHYRNQEKELLPAGTRQQQ
jgi:hypothetical protein